MRIGLYHGYELSGSGSNEFTRYLAKSLVEAGHEVHVICCHRQPEDIPFITHAQAWTTHGDINPLFSRGQDRHPACFLHQLPHGDVRPVYLTDQQRPGHVKSFVSLSDQELDQYLRRNESLLTLILRQHKLDVLHCNHLVCQPIAAVSACKTTRTPLVIYPHGSSIEYTVKPDRRYQQLAQEAIVQCAGLIIGNHEVQDRILNLFPQHRQMILDKTRIVGVGVDTSLFEPIDRTGRHGSIQQLVATDPRGGKPRKMTDELHHRLANGDLEATRDYWDQYDHALPDADLDDKLQRIPWEQNIVLFVGALTVGKGVQSILTSLPSVLHKNPNTHFVIVGAGAYREVLEALVYAISRGDRHLLLRLCATGKDLDHNELVGPWKDVQAWLGQASNLSFVLRNGTRIDAHVHFLGRLDHTRLQYVFPCADLAIFPSVVPEAYPLVVMESMSNGVLPMVSYFSGFKESVDGLTSLLGPTITEKMKIPMTTDQRIAGIISNMERLLSDQNLAQIGVRLRQIAVEQYDWKIRASQMIRAYRSYQS